jgi:hypothetical protein
MGIIKTLKNHLSGNINICFNVNFKIYRPQIKNETIDYKHIILNKEYNRGY